MGLKFTLNETLESIQKLDETILENTKGETLRKKWRIPVSFLQTFTVFWLEVT